MKYVAALLLALAMLVVPGLAFVPNIPVSDIDKISEDTVSESGYYSFTRVAVDANDLNAHLTDPAYTQQYVYSGMLFGADETDAFGPEEGDGYTAGVLGNVIKTKAYRYALDPLTGEETLVLEDGVNSDTTRQYVNQGGSMYLTMSPIGSDAETEVAYNEMGFTKTNLAWISSKLDQFEVELASQGAIGGNFLTGVPNELSPVCQNAWLIERECGVLTEDGLIDYQGPITVTAIGDADLKEAFAGSKSTAGLKLYPEDVDSVASAKMSGYAERFAGYTDADVAGNRPSEVFPADYSLSWSDNRIEMDLGDGIIENFWMAGTGVAFDAPECTDFPEEFSAEEQFGPINWPNTPEA
jgi:hypothetical protein